MGVMPIYYLEPNVLIDVSNSQLDINDTYIANRLTIPLKPGSTGNINGIKAQFRMWGK